MTTHKHILFINMAKGFGGGEFYTEQLIKNLNDDQYTLYFFGKKGGKLSAHIKQHMPNVYILTIWQLIKLVFTHKHLIIHALDGRSAHIAGLFKRLLNKSSIITRQVNFPFKHRSSLKAYQTADMLVGVSQEITKNLTQLNPNCTTIYGCIKPLQENAEFEQQYFSQKNDKLKISQIGNFQTVKNFPLTIELAKHNPNIHFYLVGAGELEQDLKQQAAELDNVEFIPFTPYIGSVLKQTDLLIVPSHSEGLGMVILEAYQYQVPVIAHSTGGIPEIIDDQKTGFLVHKNCIEEYQLYLNKLIAQPNIIQALKSNIPYFLAQRDFSAQRMANQYRHIYQSIFDQTH